MSTSLLDLPEHLAGKILPEPMSGCWFWTGALSEGYGVATPPGRRTTTSAHRLVYEHIHGPVAKHLQVDHVCHNIDPTCRGGFDCSHRSCVNPSHMRVVTRLENWRAGHGSENVGRWQAAKTHCPQGHVYDDENTRVVVKKRGSLERRCRACEADRRAARRTNLRNERNHAQ